MKRTPAVVGFVAAVAGKEAPDEIRSAAGLAGYVRPTASCVPDHNFLGREHQNV